MNQLSILGGGPAGLAIAFYAGRVGIPFELFEKSSFVGGLCRTVSFQNHSYDTGAHRFHDRDPEVTGELRELMDGRLRPVVNPSKVFLAGRFVDFPPTPINLLRTAGVCQMGRIAFDLIRARRRHPTLLSFADFATHHFGKTLAEKFLLNYSEKVWGLPAAQLSPAVATRRLSGMNLKTLFRELVAPSSKTNHLDGQFLYPVNGYGRIVDALVERISGEHLRTDHKVLGLETDGRTITGVKTSRADYTVQGRVVSTLPLTLLVRFLTGFLPDEVLEASRGLRFRNVRLIFLRLRRERFTQNASIYIPDLNLCISRIYEPRNRCQTMAPEGETGIVAEVPCFEDDPVGRLAEAELSQRVVTELEKLGLLNQREVLAWQHRFLPNAYPVYSLDYVERVEAILDALRIFQNLDILGRNGLFHYSHLHDQLRFALDYVTGLDGIDSAVLPHSGRGSRVTETG